MLIIVFFVNKVRLLYSFLIFLQLFQIPILLNPAVILNFLLLTSLGNYLTKQLKNNNLNKRRRLQ